MLTLIVILICLVTLHRGLCVWLKPLLAVDDAPLLYIISGAVLLWLVSFSYFLSLTVGLSFFWLTLIYATITIILDAILRKRLIIGLETAKQSPWIDLWPIAAVFLLTVYFLFDASKYGGWDAWAMWNLKAKYLCYPNQWKGLFDYALVYSSRDYPLMLPSSIAFLWKSFGTTSPLIPMVFGYLIFIAIPVTLYYALVDRKHRIWAFTALLIFMCDSNFKQIGIAQQPDALLALFILLVFILYKTGSNALNKQTYVLGFVCASCGWIKNEGLMFSVIFTIVFLVASRSNRSVVFKYLAGAAIPFIGLIWYKFVFTPHGGAIYENHIPFSSSVFNAGRYWAIISYWTKSFVTKYWVALLLLLIACWRSRRFFTSLPFVVIILLLFSYFCVFLLVPSDVDWEMSTSLYRLLMHPYPAFIYLIFCALEGRVKLKFPIKVKMV